LNGTLNQRVRKAFLLIYLEASDVIETKWQSMRDDEDIAVR
jgi:hypothetical protein